MRLSLRFEKYHGEGLESEIRRGQVMERKGFFRGAGGDDQTTPGVRINPRTLPEWEQGGKKPEATTGACLAFKAKR
jgi:hypothetical protein